MTKIASLQGNTQGASNSSEELRGLKVAIVTKEGDIRNGRLALHSLAQLQSWKDRCVLAELEKVEDYVFDDAWIKLTERIGALKAQLPVVERIGEGR